MKGTTHTRLLARALQLIVAAPLAVVVLAAVPLMVLAFLACAGSAVLRASCEAFEVPSGHRPPWAELVGARLREVATAFSLAPQLNLSR